MIYDCMGMVCNIRINKMKKCQEYKDYPIFIQIVFNLKSQGP